MEKKKQQQEVIYHGFCFFSFDIKIFVFVKAKYLVGCEFANIEN